VRTNRNILSFFLLSIYCFVVLHAVIPHFHLSTEAHTEEAHAHHTHTGTHGHSHQHSALESSNANWLEAIIGIFADFDHIDICDDDHADCIIQTATESFNGITKTPAKSIDLAFVSNPFSVIQPREAIRNYDPPALIYTCLEQHADPLRGPPSLS
jgi:hypothetical protein